MATIVLQRGHVPRTSGATGAAGEQQYAIATADLTAQFLRQLGHDVRIIDADPVDKRVYRGDAFIALHWDSSANPTASGASVGYQTAEGERFAQRWKFHYKYAGWTRRFHPDNYTAALRGYYGVREAVKQGNRLAIITEAGFVTNSHDKAMMSPQLTAASLVSLVTEFFGRNALVEGTYMPYPVYYVPDGGERGWYLACGPGGATKLTPEEYDVGKEFGWWKPPVAVNARQYDIFLSLSGRLG